MPFVSGNYYLNMSQMQNNAELIWAYGYSEGWTKEATAAILGNMQAESSINPGIWESLVPYGGGYGLVQWTPYTKYSQWATGQGYSWQDNGPAELLRISYEAANNIQWFYNAEVGMAPPITFQEFLESELSVSTLSDYWLYFYEHPRDPIATRQTRRDNAAYWYNYLDDEPPEPPEPPEPEPQFPIWLLFRFNRWRFS